jgi:hypothetical protein
LIGDSANEKKTQEEEDDEAVDSEEEWDEVPDAEEEGAIVSETMVIGRDMLDHAEFMGELERGDYVERMREELLAGRSANEKKTKKLVTAPAEGNSPLSMYRDNSVLTLAFPNIFAGETVDLPKGLHFGTYAKWLIMHVDPRCRLDLKLLFYLVKRVQKEMAISQIQ